VGESDRLVTVLTRDMGVIRAFARRAKSMKDSKNSATQLLCYSRLNIHDGRGKYIINEAFPIEIFFDLRKDIVKLSLAQYFCSLAAEIVPEAAESEDYLRLVLNALHFLAKTDKPELVVKAVSELRMLSISGYMPDLVCCSNCGKYEDDLMYFMIDSAVIFCSDCFTKTNMPYAVLSRASLTAMRHIIYSDFDKIFAFNISPTAQRECAAAVEAYVLSIVQHRMMTLDFYHSLQE